MTIILIWVLSFAFGLAAAQYQQSQGVSMPRWYVAIYALLVSTGLTLLLN